MWNIEKLVSKGDYMYAIVREHPSATKHGYVLEHRIVVENDIGRLLTKVEVVHHIDGNKKNNDISNLEVMSKSAHYLHHKKTGRKYLKIKCPNCRKIFEREARHSHLVKGGVFSSCSRDCMGKILGEINSYGGITDKLKTLISESIISEFTK